MQPREEKARDIACGKWPAILGKWLDERALAGRHTACPMCGGKDRWRFDNKGGNGTWICSHCGAGDGLQLLQHLNNWAFQEAAQYVESVAGKFVSAPIKQPRGEADIRADLRNVWEAGQRVVVGDPVHAYLVARCRIVEVSAGLRYHPALPYFHEDGKATKHPAMLAQVIGADNTPVSIHRTYLTGDGKKADLPIAKKLMTPVRKMENVAIRLARPADGWLGVAEGIETSLCASARYRIPVWSCVSAGLLETFRPPEGIKMVTVFGDNDTSFTGQASAYKLARALVALGIDCTVCIPQTAGHDWADEVIA